MARFRATIKGQRGEASRLGTTSGMTANVNGWDVGVRIIARTDQGADMFDVYLTGGSNGGRNSERLIGTVSQDTLGKPAFWLGDLQHRMAMEG